MLYLNFITNSKYRLSIFGRRYYERYGEDEFINKTLEFQIGSNVGGLTGVSSSFRIGNMYEQLFRLWTLEFVLLLNKKISFWPYFQVIHWGDTRLRWLTNTSISYRITDKTFFRIYFQAESNTDTPSKEAFAFEELKSAGNNLLFGYELAPRSVLYLVYNLQWISESKITDHIFMIKFTCSFRF
jgi:hypothetical protein